MPRRMLVFVLAAFAWVCMPAAKAQSTLPQRVGVVFEGGTAYQEMLDGLKDGLRELGLEDSRHYVLDVRNLQGDLRLAAEAAHALERGGVG